MSIVVNNWRIEPSLNGLSHIDSGEIRRLGEYHFILLELLVANPDVVLTREYLMSTVWKNRVVGSNSLPTAIHALRIALGDEGKQKEIIKTIPKKGYILSRAFVSQDTCNTDSEDQQPPPTEQPAVAELLPANISCETLPTEIRKTKFTLKAYLMAVLILAVGIAWGGWFFYKQPVVQGEDESVTQLQPALTDESVASAENIKIYRYMSHGKTRKSVSIFNHKMRGLIQSVDKLLKGYDAKLTAYYSGTLYNLDIALLIDDNCGRSRQVSLNVEHWQDDPEMLQKVIYRNVEETLNEMPECE